MNALNLLEQRGQLDLQIMQLRDKLADIDAQLETYVREHGEVSGGGLRARMKPGRKSINHEGAWRAEYDAVFDDESKAALSEIAEKHTTVKTSVAWAKVTKEAGIDTSGYVTQSAPSFVVEVVK